MQTSLSPSVCRAFLGCQIEKAVDELNLSKKIISCHPSSLPLPDHVDCFVALNRSPSCLEFSEALLGVHSTFDGSMILFQNVVQVLHGSVSTAGARTKYEAGFGLPPFEDRGSGYHFAILSRHQPATLKFTTHPLFPLLVIEICLRTLFYHLLIKGECNRISISQILIEQQQILKCLPIGHSFTGHHGAGGSSYLWNVGLSYSSLGT